MSPQFPSPPKPPEPPYDSLSGDSTSIKTLDSYKRFWSIALFVSVTLAFAGGMLVGSKIGYNRAKKEFTKPVTTKVESAKTPDVISLIPLTDPDSTYKIETKSVNDFSLSIEYVDAEWGTTESAAWCHYSKDTGLLSKTILFYINNSFDSVVIFMDADNSIKEININNQPTLNGHKCDEKERGDYCTLAKAMVVYWAEKMDWPTQCANYKPPAPPERTD